MKPEDPSAVPDAGIARVASATDRRNSKKLKLSLEGGNSGSAVVLHCQGRIIFRGEARALATIAAEVLPSARRMVEDFAGVNPIRSGGLGGLVITPMWAERAGCTLKLTPPTNPV